MRAQDSYMEAAMRKGAIKKAAPKKEEPHSCRECGRSYDAHGPEDEDEEGDDSEEKTPTVHMDESTKRQLFARALKEKA